MKFPFMSGSKRPRGLYSHEQIARWIELYQQGQSYRQIAEADSVPYPTVFWYIKTRFGISDGRKTGRKLRYGNLTEYQKMRQRNLRKYGLTLEDFDEMVRKQGGTCAICRKTPKGGRTSTSELHVDHDHRTGRVRGLLCQNCNPAIGQFADDPVVLQAAIAYLSVPSEEAA